MCGPLPPVVVLAAMSVVVYAVRRGVASGLGSLCRVRVPVRSGCLPASGSRCVLRGAFGLVRGAL